jgi:hypothetical protein
MSKNSISEKKETIMKNKKRFATSVLYIILSFRALKIKEAKGGGSCE